MMQNDYKEIYEIYFKDVYLYILSICKNEYIAEEITQETFFKALKKFDTFRGDCKIYSWLCQIAKNTYYDYLKKENRNLPLENYECFDLTVDIGRNLENVAQSMEAHKVLHKLQEPYKEVFTLRVFAELSFKQIGEIFNKSDGWARVAFYRAKNKILEELK